MRVFSLLTIVFFAIITFAAQSQTYEVKKYVFGSSAQTVSNSEYTFDNTVGQPAIGEYSSTSNIAKVGFWYNPSNPEEQTLTIEFTQGWNLVSSNVRPEFMDMETFMSDIELNTVIAKDGNADIYLPSANINTIGDWKIPEGYQVYVSDDCSLEVTGSVVNPVNETLSINIRWNYIGYTRNSPMSPADAFASILSKVVIVQDENGKVFIPKYNLNTIGDLDVGKGYKLFSTNNQTFTYPANSMGKSYQDDYFDNITKHFIPEYIKTGQSSVILIHTDLPDNSEIAVFNYDDNLLGAGVVKNNIAAITIWGDNEMTESIDGAIEGQELYCKYYFKGTEQKIKLNNINSITDDNNELTYNESSLKTADAYTNSNKNQIFVSPNPVQDRAIVQFNLNYASNAELKLVNTIGKTVKLLANRKFNASAHTVNFNTEGLAQGAYFIILTTDEQVLSKPVMIVK